MLNCPAEELDSFERILFLVEQAHWYYEDFVREEPENKHMRSMKLREFAELTFHRCAALSKYRGKVDGIYKNFLMYKLSIPTGGLIILNPQLDKVLLVKGWNSGSSWGFPKGKINKTSPSASARRGKFAKRLASIFPRTPTRRTPSSSRWGRWTKPARLV